MCDPVTLAISAGLGAAGKIAAGSEAQNAAAREAAARNAVLKTTLDKENGLAGQNATLLNGNVAGYAPGAQDTQLHAAQDARTATSTGNISAADPNSVPITSDAPPAVRGEIAKRMLAAHDGAVDRAKLSGKLGGFGDTWLTNQLRTSEADRNIGVNNNYAEGNKSILPALQDDAAAAVYKPPSIWSTILGGASNVAAGAAGAGKGLPSLGGSGGFSLLSGGSSPVTGLGG